MNTVAERMVPVTTVNRENPNELAEAVDRLVQAYRPRAVYLFGSQARGEAHPNSDLDFCVIVDDDANMERRRSGIAARTLRSLGIASDVVVWRRGRFDEALQSVTSLPSTVRREGILLYDAES